MSDKTLALVISGGVAPGSSVVTQTVFNEARQYGFKKVLFIRDAFMRLQEGKTERAVLEFSSEEVKSFHLLGGSLQGNSKPGSPVNEADFVQICSSLEKLKVSHLLAVGGDDSARTLCQISAYASELKIALIPKTMDDDVAIAEGAHTLGVSTTVEQAAKDFRALQANARQLERQYMLLSMGRNSGRTPYMIGRAAGADLILVREFFKTAPTLLELAKIILGSRLLKELENPFPKPFSHGVLIAENMIEMIEDQEIEKLRRTRKDSSVNDGNLKLSEVPFAKYLENAVSQLFKKLGKKRVVTCETMGAAPRGYPANARDLELAKCMSLHALSLLAADRGGLVVYCKKGVCKEKKLSSLWDEKTKKGRTRMLSSEMLKEAKKELLYLKEADFKGEKLKKLAAQANLSPAEFKSEFLSSQKVFL